MNITDVTIFRVNSNKGATRMIDKLTDEQIARMAEFRDKWISIGLSTEPACREKAEAAIKQIYTCAGLAPPRKIVWCGSPLSGGLTRAIILDKKLWDSVGASVWASVGDSVWASVGDSVGDSVRASVWASVWDSVGASVGASVRASVGASVRASVWASVWDSVGDSVGASVRASVGASVGASVWDSVGASVGASVWASVWDSVGASVWDSVWASGYGQHDANWLAYLEYFREVCGLSTQTDKASGLIEQAKRAGWYLPHQNICWVSERHNLLLRDERGRLHSGISPAVTFPDGWAIYAWHGVRVPEAVIEQRDKTTVQQIIAESNTEIRRVMRNLYGDARFMVDAGAKEIDQAKQHGATLLALRLPGDPVELRMMSLVCPTTGNKYFERVPPDVKTAIEGLSWRFNVGPKDYKPTWET